MKLLQKKYGIMDTENFLKRIRQCAENVERIIKKDELHQHIVSELKSNNSHPPQELD